MLITIHSCCNKCFYMPEQECFGNAGLLAYGVRIPLSDSGKLRCIKAIKGPSEEIDSTSGESF